MDFLRGRGFPFWEDAEVAEVGLACAAAFVRGVGGTWVLEFERGLLLNCG